MVDPTDSTTYQGLLQSVRYEQQQYQETNLKQRTSKELQFFGLALRLCKSEALF